LYVDGVCKDDKQTCTGDGAVAGECGDKTTAAGTAYKCDCKEPNVCNTTTKKCEACPAGTLWVDGVCKDDKQVCTGEGAVGGECGVEKTTAAGTKYTCKCDAPNVCNTTTHVCEACPEGTLYVEGVCVDDTQVCTGDGASGGECGDKTTDAGTAYTCTCKAPFVCNETTVLCEQCKVGWTYEDGKCVEDSEEA
jgi:hypothetical protein